VRGAGTPDPQIASEFVERRRPAVPTWLGRSIIVIISAVAKRHKASIPGTRLSG
jgi:hypothetical protein